MSFSAGPTTITDYTYSRYATVNLCSTIWDDYAPMLSIPAEFKSMNPAGHMDGNIYCPLNLDPSAVFYDPPIALLQTTAMADPTMLGSNYASKTAEMNSAGAYPGGIPGPTTPLETALHKTHMKSTGGYETRTASHEPEGTAPAASPKSIQKDPISSYRSTKSDSATKDPTRPVATGTVVDPAHTDPQDASAAISVDPIGVLTSLLKPGVDSFSKDPKNPTTPKDSRSGQSDPAGITGAIGTANSGNVVIGTATFDPGDIGTIAGTKISVGKSASYIVVDGKTQKLTPGAAVMPASESAIGTVRSGYVVVGTATLKPGDVQMISGNIVSVGTSASFLVVNGQTQEVSAGADIAPATKGAIATVQSGDIVIGGMTLEPGDVGTIHGTTISVGKSASYIVVNGKTRNLLPGTSTTQPSESTRSSTTGSVLLSGSLSPTGAPGTHPASSSSSDATTTSRGSASKGFNASFLWIGLACLLSWLCSTVIAIG